MKFDNLPALDLTSDVILTTNDDGDEVLGFTIVGKNSQQYRDQVKANRVSAHQRGAKKKTQIDASTESGARELVDLIAKNDQKTAAAVVVNWRGFTVGGKPAPFNKDQVIELLEAYPSWIDKILIALEAEANFTKSK